MNTIKKDTVLYFIMLLLAVCVLLLSVAVGQISPKLYYRFENTGVPTIGSGTISGAFTYTNGQVGRSAVLSTSTNLLSGGSITATSMTVEFLYRPSYNFDKTDYASFVQVGGNSVSVSFMSVSWFTKATTGGRDTLDRYSVVLDGINQGNYSSWNDSSWHHVVCTYDAATGKKIIYLNGVQCFTKNAIAWNLSSPASLNLNSNTSYAKFYGGIDEIAVYDAAMSPNQVYKHYQDISAGNPYSFTLSATRPANATIKAANDSNYYGLGHTVGVLNSSDYTNSHLTQLQTFPLPRYSTLNNPFQRNFNWADPSYQAGKGMNGVTGANVSLSRSIQEELYKKWQYGVMAIVNANVSGDAFTTEWIDLANDNPSWVCDVITNYAFSATYLKKQNYTTSKYLTNNSSAMIGPNGPAVYEGNPPTAVKYLNIYTPSSPVTDSLPKDGRSIAQQFRNTWSSLTNSIDRISENNEVIPVFTESSLKQNSTLISNQAASGLTWAQWIGAGYKRAHLPYRDSVVAVTGAQFLQYSVDGQEAYRAKWSYMRDLQTTINNDKYSTADFYPRWPSNWEHWSSAWHGWDWMAISRRTEFASNDSICAPFVSAGWSANPEEDINPAMWLGLLKCVSGLGVDFYHTGFFTLGNPGSPSNPNPKGWAWQLAMPSYAQAVNTHMPYFFQSKLMEGDVPVEYPTPDVSNYSYYAGDKRKLVVVRKHNTLNKYMIYSTINGFSNQKSHVEDSAMCLITVGSNQVKFYTRPQGSVFYFDADSSSIIQLDGWHENKHPERWSRNAFKIEAELPDTIWNKYVTYGNTGTDFRSFNTAAYGASGDTLRYRFEARNTTSTNYYFWLRAKRTTSGDGTIYVITKTDTFSIGCVNGSSYKNYNIDQCSSAPIAFNYPNDTGTFKITSASEHNRLDFFYFTTTPYAISDTVTCTTASAITASPNDTVTLPTEITLDAGSHTSYLWSTGETTQTIDVATIGTNTYTATVTDAGCNNIVSITTVIYPSTAPTASIDTSGSTTFCEGNDVYLTATSNLPITSYLWSTDDTDDQIRVQSSGTYTVTVTTSSGTASASQAVEVYQNPSVTINGCPKYACEGTKELIAISNETTTYLWSTAATTSTITADSGHTYTITVTNVDGCTDTYSCEVRSCNQCQLPYNLKVNKLSYADSGYVQCAAKINWQCASTPDYFVIEIVNPYGNTRYRNVPGRQTYIYLTGLKARKNYKIRVKAYCTTYESAFTEWINVLGPDCN